MFNRRIIKHLKLIFILFVTIVVIYTIGMKTTQSTVIAADNVTKTDSKTEIIRKIHLYADKYNVPFERMYNTIKCETAGTFNPQIQSQVIYNFSNSNRGIAIGTRERSYGLAQIHLPDHPNISIEQATNEDFALEFMAKEYSKGHDIWYCD